jgi:thioesterase domain-containing protein
VRPSPGQRYQSEQLAKTNGDPERLWLSAETMLADLQAFMKERLPSYMIPAAIVLLDSIPLTPNGKLDRRALPEPVQAVGLKVRFIGPRDALELQLAQIWQDILKAGPVGVRDNFFDRGGHSLLAVRLLARIRQALAIDLPLSVFFKQQPTIEHLAADIRQRVGGVWQQFSPLVEIQRGVSGPAFFCVHPSGGNVLCYADLARHLGVDQSFYGLQAQGLDPAQVALTSIEEMATSYIEAVHTIQPVGPYFLGGWSMGGLVAFEMAQQLQAQGQEVSMLALIDTNAPTPEARLADPDEISFMVSFARDMGLAWEQLTVPRDELMRLDPGQQLAYLLELAMAGNVLPPDVDPSQVERLYQVFKTNVRAMLDYSPQPLPAQITLFQAEERLGEPGDSRKGWERFALEGVELLTVPGNHYTMVREPHVRVLARYLSRCMAKEPAYV